MATKNTIKSNRRKLQVHFLDMDENIFRVILQHLDAWEVYRNLRLVCRKFNDYAKRYIQHVPEKLFIQSTCSLLTFLPDCMVNIPLEYLMALKHPSGKIASLRHRVLPSPILRGEQAIIGEYFCKECYYQTAFVNKIAAMLVIGYFYSACSNCKSQHLSLFQLNETHTLDDDEWNLLLAYYDFHVMKWCPIIVSGKTMAYEQPGLNDCVSICKLSDSSLVLFNDRFDDQLTILRYTFNLQDTSKGILKQGDYKHDQELDIGKCVEKCTLTCSLKKDRFIFEEEEDMHEIVGCCLVQAHENKVMLVGGFYRHYSSHTVDMYNQKLWEGAVADETENLIFRAVDLNHVQPRVYPMCFRLRDNVYIAGGEIYHLNDNCIDGCTCINHGYYKRDEALWHHLCCDRYDVKERKYYRTDYRLPFSCHGFSHVTTDEKQTFCIIKPSTNWSRKSGKENIFLVFSEDHGFEELHSETVK